MSLHPNRTQGHLYINYGLSEAFFMPVLPKAFLTFVSGHFMALSFFTAGHDL
jgi:hypothetical protein